MTPTGPLPDILEEYWRGIQEVWGSGGGFSGRFRGEMGEEILSMLLKSNIIFYTHHVSLEYTTIMCYDMRSLLSISI